MMNIENPLTQQKIDELSELELADQFEREKKGFKMFYKMRESSGPHDEVVEAVNLVKNRGQALEIGPGNHIEVKYMIEQGFSHITAIGPDDTAEHAKNIEESKLTSIQDTIANHKFEASSFDFINTSLIFPFIEKDLWLEIMDNLKNALRSEGIFSGIFFGENSSMVTDKNKASTNTDELKSFFDEENFEIKKLDEAGPKQTAKGVYNNIIIVVQKK